MGYNTVVVLYNDALHFGEKDPLLGKRICSAACSWTVRDHVDRLDISAHTESGGGGSYGRVISQDHADYSQVVIAGNNTGSPIRDCENIDICAQEQMAEALQRCGWKVSKPRRKRNA